MNASEVAARYQQPGKKAARKFVVDLAIASGCRTALDFWGGGTSARDFTRAGLSVVSAEMDRSLWSELDRDATANDYVAHHGRASKADGVFDIVWADFCGTASETTRRELAPLAEMATKWIVVTLAPDHQTDQALTGAMSLFTVPAWLMGATGFQLEYLQRYARNEGGQWMWMAVLRRRAPNESGLKDGFVVARTIRHRRYWCSVRFGTQFAQMLEYKRPLRPEGNLERNRAYAKTKYWSNPEKYRERERARRAADPERFKMEKSEWSKANREKINARKRERRRLDPDRYREYDRRADAKRGRAYAQESQEGQPKPALPIAA